MLDQALILDAHDESDRAEGALVTALIARAKKTNGVARSYLGTAADLPADLYTLRRSVVWFCGHATHYRKAKIVSFERRAGRAFRRLFRHEDVARIPARLLVLSTCHSAIRLVREQSFSADMVVAYRGVAYNTMTLAFAAYFVAALMRNVRRDRMDVDVVRHWFHWAQWHTGDRGWCFWVPSEE